MKIKITESQLKNLRKVINERNTALDDLNNFINPKIFEYKKDFTTVTFDNIILEGDIDDGLNVNVSIDKVLHNDDDVTSFAKAWAIKDYDTGDELTLGYYLSLHVADILNQNYTKYIGTDISEYDIYFE